MTNYKQYVCPLEDFWTKPTEDKTKALTNVVKSAVKEHHDAGKSVVVEREGKVVDVPPPNLILDLMQENKQLRLVLSYCGVNKTNPDTCGCCGLHFEDCEADMMCYIVECESCKDEFIKRCHVCDGKELYSEEFWSCPGAHARAALK